LKFEQDKDKNSESKKGSSESKKDPLSFPKILEVSKDPQSL